MNTDPRLALGQALYLAGLALPGPAREEPRPEIQVDVISPGLVCLTVVAGFDPSPVSRRLLLSDRLAQQIIERAAAEAAPRVATEPEACALWVRLARAAIMTGLAA